MNRPEASMQPTTIRADSRRPPLTISRDEPTNTGNRWNGMTLPEAHDDSWFARNEFSERKHLIPYGILTTGVMGLKCIVGLQARGVIPSARQATIASDLANCQGDNATMADNWQQAEHDNSTMADMLEEALGTIADMQEVIASLYQSSTADSCTPTATFTVASSLQGRDEIYVMPAADEASTTPKN
ncbi:hypothetical protein I302_104608 [Kwoniella bestiolae CBS 10118]|uniref:Uncharacterized protein n=1 Tax=Kwoniella bestiolae CBS 10118 TaxID=1296100 RepID=A0A1B9GBR6_9TREE|nr:hypothetical protein I302_03315 [Kwoniella bestiolae CBS 10118]OCF28456.1 hypothetical protein I302_03315 [Kwoniella bestiolae CBS 10118]